MLQPPQNHKVIRRNWQCCLTARDIRLLEALCERLKVRAAGAVFKIALRVVARHRWQYSAATIEDCKEVTKSRGLARRRINNGVQVSADMDLISDFTRKRTMKMAAVDFGHLHKIMVYYGLKRQAEAARLAIRVFAASFNIA